MPLLIITSLGDLSLEAREGSEKVGDFSILVGSKARILLRLIKGTKFGIVLFIYARKTPLDHFLRSL